MTAEQEPTTPPQDLALRRAARILIASTLNEIVDMEGDWLGACRKRIKDRMSDAKHIIFNNQQKIGLLLLGRTDDIPALEIRNRQLEQTARVCAQALDILDEMTRAAPAPAPPLARPRLPLGSNRRPALRRETTTKL